MRKFLHTLAKGEERNSYLVNGRQWEGFDFASWDKLYCDAHGARLAVDLDQDSGLFQWESCIQLAEGPAGAVCFTHRGSGQTVEAACAAAIEYAPEQMIFEYLGETFPCFGEERNNGAKLWAFAVEGESAEVLGPFRSASGDGEYFTWRRYWLPAKELFEQFDCFSELNGRASTMMEAMIAAVDAPEMFKRACGKMIATLSGGAK